MTAASKSGQKNQKGGFVLGLIVGLLVGLAVALGVALYITKVPIPFVNKVPQRTAEQDAQEAERNRNWDPNAPLALRAAW
jgi:cell division protein FtsN